MAKASEIKINQSIPVKPINQQTNSTTTGTQNTVPTTANAPTTQNSTFQRSDPLWKDLAKGYGAYVNVATQLSPQNIIMQGVKGIGSSLRNPKEYRPKDAFEETVGGWNYGLDSSVSQTDNQQGHYNALNGTGHVVGMPERPNVTLNVPSTQKGIKRPGIPGTLPEENTPSEQVVSQPTPATPTAKTTTKQPTVSQQNTPVQEQPQENIVTPREFGGLQGTETPEQAEEKVQANEQAIANMESDLNQSTAGKLYGKVTADQSTAIRTMEDENSVYKAMNEARINSFKQLQTMSSDSIAASVISGIMATDSQQMRDLMQYDPAKYQEVQNQIKAIRGQMNINAITSGSGDYNTIATNGQSGISNEISSFATNNANGIASSADILKSVNSTLSSNQSASSAQEQMGMIENDMISLQNRMKNLKKEASQVFKGDVPQYIVNAYIANRTAEIQDQLGMLEQRYNAAYSRYQNEWEQTKRAAEFDLKKQQLEIQKQNAYYDNWATQQGILQGWAKLSGTANNNVTTTTLTREQISTSIDDLVTACQNGQLGNAQCAAGVQQYYFPTLGVNLGSLSAYSAKQGICNEIAGQYTPQKGDVVVMSSSSAPEYGHMGIVVGIDGDTLTYLDWNGSVENGVGTEKAAIRTTKLSNGNIYGYYNPTKWNMGTTGDEYFNPNYADIYGKFLQGKYSAGKQLETTAMSLGLTIEELRNQANAWKDSQTNNIDVQERLDSLEYLLRDSDLWRGQRQAASSNTWAGEVNRFLFSEAGDFNTAYKFIKDNITFDKLLELKRGGATFGALSDNELRAIGNSATRLHTSMDKDTWDKTLLSIYNGLRKGIGESEVTLEQIRNGEIGSGGMGWDAFNNPSSSASSQYSVEDILSI